MKKRSIAISGLVLAGAIFAGSSLYASEDVEQYEKGNQMKTLNSLGIEAKSDDLVAMKTLTDENGKEWIYNEFTKRAPLMDKIENERSVDVKDAFIEVQDEIMQKHAKVGDTIPVILLDEELKEGSFSFNREDGEALIFKLKYNEKNGKWDYEQEK
ncbi:hypothetical protein P4V43_29300 [Brevibacillus fortis]|uniref:hypothetical protein n=1 Tax=Brevibacillus TaxID=55080 RepID=UPI0003803907|nr:MULTISPECIES: hypothetical protein [Brevibacillus]ATF11234.1 hypothetical protein A616_04230 [Brevibacillus brevis X23]MED1785894.1 hypothetical protein [Brevibacillus fortis]RAT97845.1 hypothetical protein ASG16_009365 [Brevibacillus sp. Leaf182]